MRRDKKRIVLQQPPLRPSSEAEELAPDWATIPTRVSHAPKRETNETAST